MFVTEIRVMGDHDLEYTIKFAAEGASCTCPAFRYTRTQFAACKHIEYVARLLQVH